MDNVLQFPVKKKALYEVLKNETEGEKFICFYFNEDGNLSYSWGTELNLLEISYILKVLDIFVSNELQTGVEWGDL